MEMEYITLNKISENLDSLRKPITETDRIAGDIPYYGASGIVDYVQEYIFDEKLLLVSEDGANLLARSTPIAFSIDGKAWVNNHAHVLKFSNSILQKYVELYLNNISLEQYITGSAQPKLNQKMLNEIPIPIVEKSKMELMVNTIEKIDQVISKRKRELKMLDELVKARFIELFGDPNLNDKGWEKGVINDIGTCVAGATPSTQVKEYWEKGTIPWMSSGEVNKGRIFETDTKITQLGYDNASTKLVPPKTVVLAMAGQGRTRGTAAITEIELCTNQSICSIVNNEKIHAEYLLCFLKLQYMELRGASTNTDGRGGLNLKIIGNYPIMIPPIEIQNEFAAFVEQIDKSKLSIQQSLEKLETLKKSLMQQYFG